jgi:hypothetical protein
MRRTAGPNDSDERSANRHACTRKQYKRKPRPRPVIDTKCWNEKDIEFWLTGDYNLSDETPEVQVMLEMLSMLNEARVEWLMAASRAASHSGGSPDSYRDPRHSTHNGTHRRHSTIGMDD